MAGACRFLVASGHHAGSDHTSHWAIENGLHWIMDMVFRDDGCRVHTDHAPANFCTIKHMARNLIRLAPGKASLWQKRNAAGWDDEFLASIIAKWIRSPDSPDAASWTSGAHFRR